MKQVHISKNHLTSIKLEVDIDMKLADDIWLTIHDHRMFVVRDRMNFELPTIPIVHI